MKTGFLHKRNFAAVAISFFIVTFAFTANGQNHTIIASTDTACIYEPVQFRDSVPPGLVVQWRVWDMPTSNPNDSIATGYFDTPGTVTVTLYITHTNSGPDTAYYTITVLDTPTFSNYTSIDADCGLCNGGVNITVNGGAPPYTYDWDNGAATTANLTGACYGSHTLLATDANGCKAFSYAWVEVVQLNCSDGDPCTIDSCGGGTCHNPPLVCNDGDPCTLDTCIGGCTSIPIVCDDADPCTIDTCIFGLGCQSYSYFYFTTATITPATSGNCDGSATISVTGGAPPYSYQWSPSLACNDICNGILCSGTIYRLTVTDDNGCTTTGDSIDPNIPAAPAMEATPNEGCFPLQVQFTNLTTGYITWLWDFNDGNTSTLQSPTNTYVTPANYSVRLMATDSLGATDTFYTTVNVWGISVSAQAIDATCNGAFDGAVSVDIIGGTRPAQVRLFTSNIFFNSQTWDSVFTYDNLQAGTYNVMVYDTFCTSDTVTVIVGEPAPLTANVSVQHIDCIGTCDGEISVIMTGGTSPYNFDWVHSPGLPDSVLTGLCAGTYPVTVTDFNGCSYHVTPVIEAASPVIQSIVLQSPTSCPGSDGSIEIITGGNFPLEWSIDGGITYQSSGVFSGLVTGTYPGRVRDVSGCTTDSTVFLPQGHAANQVAISNSFTWACTTDTVTLIANSNGFVSYAWSGGGSGNTLDVVYTGTAGPAPWSVIATDSSGCLSEDSAFVEFDLECVWSGDVNYDGIANNLDVLSIGVAYGDTGYVRDNASIAWDGQPGDLWVDTLPGGTNLKHADCNGDGVVNQNDTTAISINYGFTHAKGPRCAATPPLFIDLPDTLYAGQTVSAPIVLGDANNLVTSLYGVAFTIYYDNTIIDTGSVVVGYDNSWMGTSGVNLLGFSKDFYPNGQTDVAIVRTDHVNLPQDAGPIGTFSFTIKDDVSGKQQLALLTSIDNVTAMDNDQNHVFICGEADSSVSVVIVNGVGNVDAPMVAVYPNPADDLLYVESNKQINTITLTDLLGKTVLTSAVEKNNAVLKIADLPESTYVLRLEFDNHVEFRKVLVSAAK